MHLLLPIGALAYLISEYWHWLLIWVLFWLAKSLVSALAPNSGLGPHPRGHRDRQGTASDLPIGGGLSSDVSYPNKLSGLTGQATLPSSPISPPVFPHLSDSADRVPPTASTEYPGCSRTPGLVLSSGEIGLRPTDHLAPRSRPDDPRRADLRKPLVALQNIRARSTPVLRNRDVEAPSQ